LKPETRCIRCIKLLSLRLDYDIGTIEKRTVNALYLVGVILSVGPSDISRTSMLSSVCHHTSAVRWMN